MKEGAAGTGTAYATVNGYAPHGAVSQLTLRNTIVETTTFNTRLQPTQIEAGTALTLTYGETGRRNGSA